MTEEKPYKPMKFLVRSRGGYYVGHRSFNDPSEANHFVGEDPDNRVLYIRVDVATDAIKVACDQRTKEHSGEILEKLLKR